MIFGPRRRPEACYLLVVLILGDPVVHVVQTTENRLADDPAFGLSRTMDRGVFLQRHVRAADVVILEDVFVQNII